MLLLLAPPGDSPVPPCPGWAARSPGQPRSLGLVGEGRGRVRADGRDGRRVVARVGLALEDARACDVVVRAVAGHLVDVEVGDAAVHLDAGGKATTLDLGAERPDLGADLRDERLPAEPGVDGHQEHEVAEIEDVEEGLHRGVRVQAHPHLDAAARVVRQGGDLLEVAVQVGAGLRVHGDAVGAGGGEVPHVALRGLDHEVAVHEAAGHGAQGLHHHGADGEVGDEVPVHDVHVDPVGAGLVDGADLLAEAGEVDAEDGRGDDGRVRGHGRV